jgi:succinate dehydrogenase hydrophobic anchor subunit
LGVKILFLASIGFHDFNGLSAIAEGVLHAHQLQIIFSINAKLDTMVR